MPENEKPEEKVRMKDADNSACPSCGKKGQEKDGKYECTSCGKTWEPKNAGVESGKNPEQEAESSATAGHTTTPGAVINQSQDVFNPSSDVQGTRTASGASAATGQSPSEVQYHKQADLSKSPLYVEMEKRSKMLGQQLESMQKAFEQKAEALQKSFESRMQNVQKSVDAMYSRPFYKDVDHHEANKTEQAESKGFSKKLADGDVRYAP